MTPNKTTKRLHEFSSSMNEEGEILRSPSLNLHSFGASVTYIPYFSDFYISFIFVIHKKIFFFVQISGWCCRISTYNQNRACDESR